MKARKRLLLPFLAALLLASCATTDDRRMATSAFDSHLVQDAQYIAAVESLAARRGVQVHWVNPPRIRVED